jgi:dTDP-4-dehydrorhamnose reductase
MIWLVGNRGMLGSDVEAILKRQGYPYVATDIEMDITEYANISAFTARYDIDWIINCAAYTMVDAAENESVKAFSINENGIANLSRLAGSIGAAIIHISTDYIFDGKKEGPYLEDDPPCPINVYGRSKLAGEIRLAAALNRYFIIRTAWLYGDKGNNFVKTMIKKFSEDSEVRVVSDQWGSPTYAKDLAEAILAIVSAKSLQYGIYHFTNEGKTNWYDFALQIHSSARTHGLINRDIRIVPVTTSEYPTKAARPMNSWLSKIKYVMNWALTVGIGGRPWKNAS